MSRYPTTGIAGCCARAASGHTAAEPPSAAMNSRLLMRYPQGRGSHPTTLLKEKPCCALQQFWPPDFRNGSSRAQPLASGLQLMTAPPQATICCVGVDPPLRADFVANALVIKISFGCTRDFR